MTDEWATETGGVMIFKHIQYLADLDCWNFFIERVTKDSRDCDAYGIGYATLDEALDAANLEYEKTRSEYD